MKCLSPVFFLFSLLMASLMVSCGEAGEKEGLQEGSWRFELVLKPHVTLPFTADLKRDGKQEIFTIHNADERLPMDALVRKGDSVFLHASVFDSEFKGIVLADGSITGAWYDYSRGNEYSIPFTARPSSESRFPISSTQSASSLEGSYQTHFSPLTDGMYPALAHFQQTGNQLSGTFQTETGDYRFLEGEVGGSQFALSAFDGSHAFLFAGKARTDGVLVGSFYSGNHWEEPFVAYPTEDTEGFLRTAKDLTYLKEGYDEVSFSFPNAQGEQVSLTDARYKGKAVIVQVLGSWCPNCMDETRLYAEWYKKYKDQGLEIIGLAFERAPSEEQSWKAIARMKKALGVEYEILLAANSNDKAIASEKLPMLNRVISYPTSIYLDKEGNVQAIHTGFNGPGTGLPYEEFVAEYEELIQSLL